MTQWQRLFAKIRFCVRIKNRRTRVFADILTESLEHEKAQISKLHAALKLVEGSDIYLEEFIRDMIVSESDHVSEIEKMIRGKT